MGSASMILIEVEPLAPPPKQVFLMSGEQIDEHWANIQRLMLECPGYYDFYTPEWTYMAAKKGDIQVWALSDGAIRGIIVSQILVFPAQKAFEILGAAGVGLLDFFDELDKVFEMIATDAGCATIMFRTRPGIERIVMRKHRMLKYASWVYRPIEKNRRH